MLEHGTDPDDSSDAGDEDSSSDGSDGAFRRPRQSRPIQTVASTRERRYRPGAAHGSRRRRQAPISANTGLTTPKKRALRPVKPGGAKKKSPIREDPKPDWPTSGVIPPWKTLEWTILVQIFEYAAHPLDTRSNVRWLLHAGLTCKAFLSPALKALYKCAMPQLISLNMSNKFAGLVRELTADAAAALTRQDHRRTMVESLVVEVSSLPHSQNRNTFDIAELVLSLPSLSYVELYHDFDLPPYRKLDLKNKKWVYTPELLSALKVAGDAETAVRLKTWKWSERMMGPGLLGELSTIHSWRTFSQLRTLSFVNFQVPSLKDNKDPNDPDVFEADKDYIGLVAATLASVTGLKHLIMESSTVVDGQFMSLLPKTIEHLEIVNCWELTADMLSDYLITHGGPMRRLTLHHNQSLNLSFLPFLGQHCPQLRELSMDLLTYNHHEYYKDSDPIYETLLTVSDVPQWPQTLEVIDLAQLAKWDADTAEMFFQSFVDQAPNLPRLRHLAVKAMLDVPWRQRSEFRDKWVKKLKSVFLRKTRKPQAYHSLIQWPLDGEKQRAKQEAGSLKADQDSDASPIRRSTRIASHVFRPAPPPITDNKDNKRKRKRSFNTTTRDLRKPKRINISYRDPDTDEDLELLEDSEDSNRDELATDPTPLSSPPASPASIDDEGEPFIHGLCDVVNIRFDNQKPREFQWGAEDFLDEETHESDDAEWTSDRELDDDSVTYAW